MARFVYLLELAVPQLEAGPTARPREHDCVEPKSKLRISDLADLNICVSNHCKFDIWSSLKHNMKLSWGNQKIHIIVQSDITLIG